MLQGVGLDSFYYIIYIKLCVYVCGCGRQFVRSPMQLLARLSNIFSIEYFQFHITLGICEITDTLKIS